MHTTPKNINSADITVNTGHDASWGGVCPPGGRGGRERGFTLIELMIVVVITAILASIAVSSYRNHVIKSNRAAAESFMMQIANKEEQYMLDARTYTTTIGAGGLNLTVPGDVSVKYTFAIATAGVAYVITATPTAAQNDAHCGNLTLDQAGKKGASNSDCW